MSFIYNFIDWQRRCPMKPIVKKKKKTATVLSIHNRFVFKTSDMKLWNLFCKENYCLPWCKNIAAKHANINKEKRKRKPTFDVKDDKKGLKWSLIDQNQRRQEANDRSREISPEMISRRPCSSINCLYHHCFDEVGVLPSTCCWC